jgi:hypothetical protein
MGAGFSTEMLSEDGVWGSVSLWDEECKKRPDEGGKNNWYMLAPDIFDGLTDSDFENIASIIVAKKSAGENRERWTVNHDVIRIIDIKWDPKEKGYDYTASVRLVDEDGGNPEINTASYPTYRMHRLAIHLEALKDYKKMRFGGGDGSLFERISKELEQYHVAF